MRVQGKHMEYNLATGGDRLQVGSGIICIMPRKHDGNSFREACDCYNQFNAGSKI